jgi:large subunit ribosomal protein L22
MATEVSKAILMNLRISPRKVRLVVDLVRGKPVQYAIDLLKNTNKRSAPIVAKMIESAVANAKDKSSAVDVDRLFVSSVMVGAGSTMKRWLPRAQGSASQIQKRSSHVTLKLSEK